MFEDIIANVLSNLDYDNINYKLDNVDGKTIIEIVNENESGKITFESF